MAYAKLHASFPQSPKHQGLSDAAFRWWVCAVCWTNEHLTDGFIPEATVKTFHPKALAVLVELTESHIPGKAPLLHQVTGGYRLHDFEDWNTPKGAVQEGRRLNRARQAKWRSAVTNAPRNGVSNALRGDVTNATPVCVTNASLARSDTDTDTESLGRSGGSTPPLVGKRHLDAPFDWRVPVPAALHERFVRRLGGNPPEAAQRLQRWYQSVALRIGDGPTGGADEFEFWRTEFKAWQGEAPSAKPQREVFAPNVPFMWRCKHCLQLHEVAQRALFASFRCPTLDATASVNGRPA